MKRKGLLAYNPQHNLRSRNNQIKSQKKEGKLPCLGVLGEAPDWEAAINFLGFLKKRGREKEECAYEMCLGLLGE